MKKSISILLCIMMLFFTFLISGCVYADQIEEGTYVSKTPYIKYIKNLSLGYTPTAEIEIDRTVYEAFTRTSYVGTIYFDVIQNDYSKNNDSELYARFDYKFDSEKKQLILTDMDNGNVYHLDKVE